MTRAVEREAEEATADRGRRGNLAEVAQVSLKLGFTAFGGPAAHIAMLREEVVSRRHWLSDEYFLDLVGATNLIPGPNSTEMVIHVGLLRAGRLVAEGPAAELLGGDPLALFRAPAGGNAG